MELFRASTIALFTLILFADAALYRQRIKLQPGGPRICKFEGKSLNVGESMVHDTLCQEISCNQGYNQNELELEMKSCGVMAAPENCRIVYSTGVKYPKCCEGRIVCP